MHPTTPPEIETLEELSLGTPAFYDPALVALARADGPLAAWRKAVASASAPGAAVAQVGGTFAVAFREASGRTVLAVDRFAVHSICYRVVDGRLRFAARADALAGTTPQLDPQALFDYLYWHAIPSPRTVFEGVMRLPPGHVAVFEHGQLTVDPYWTPTFDAPRSEISFERLRDEFRGLLRDAVKAKLDGGTPACFLSGGTDSSTVAGMIGEVAGRPAATYSIGFEAEGYDEMDYARIAARHFGTDHHEYYVTPSDLVSSIPKVAAAYDQPFGNSSAVPAYHCALMARGDGVTTLLAGDGGDELFGGNTRYAKQRVFDWYGVAPRALRSTVIEPVLGLPGVGKVPPLRKARSYVEQARVPMPDRLQTYNLLGRLGLQAMLDPRFLEQVDPLAPARQQREVWAQARASTLVDRMLAFDWRYTLAETDLPKVTGTAALAGVTARFPLLDDALVDFSMRLPSDYKLRRLKLRWFFKEALRGFLPDEILVKKKQGFGLPFGVWATRHPALLRLATDSLEALAARGIVRPDFIRTLVREHLPAHPGYYGEMVWILMMLEQWLAVRCPGFAMR